MNPIDCIGPAGMAAVIRDLDPFQWAPRMPRATVRAASCYDCGPEYHPTDSVYCPVRQAGDCED